MSEDNRADGHSGRAEDAGRWSRRRVLQSIAPLAGGVVLSAGSRTMAKETVVLKKVDQGKNAGFAIDVPRSVLDDLAERLARIRWPDEIPGANWDYGANKEYLMDLVTYWREDYDWRKQEAQLNALPHFQAEVDGMTIHFVHVEGKGPNPRPLLLLHGWPDSFYRFIKLIPLLTDPEKYGGSADDSFTVIVPDLPGFGFSGKQTERGWGPVRIADALAKLMRDSLGYSRFLAHAGDYGATILEQLALKHSELLAAIHMTDIPPQHAAKADPAGLTDPEKAYLSAMRDWAEKEGAYAHIQSTKPQTLSYGLNDSPVGLLAWIMEKFNSWSDARGPLERVISRDELLTNVMIYWITESMASAIRVYFEKAHNPLPESTFVKVPTCYTSFTHDLVPPPRRWVERIVNLQYWNEIDHGGHFAALEVPEVLASEIRKSLKPYET